MTPMLTTERQNIFLDHFSELADVVEDACRYGVSPGLETRYAGVRAWMLTNYRLFKIGLAPYLPQVVRKGNLSWEAPHDSVESLFHPPTLDELCRRSQVSLGQTLSQTRHAVQECFEKSGTLQA